MILTRDLILAAQDLKAETVSVPEWGGDVLVRGMTGAERDAFESSVYTGTGKDRKENFSNLRARMISACLIGEDGKPLFTEKDVLILGKKSASALDRVFEVAQRLSGMGKKDLDAAKGNSDAGQADASASS